MRIAGNRPAQKQCRKDGVNPLRKEKSCGALVYRTKNGEVELLLLKHRFGGHWSFPKGHVEKKETEEDTALREIREETGLEVLLDTGFRRVVTYLPKPNVKKDVVYFAARFQSGSPEAQPEEVMDIVWASPDKALQLVTYQNDVETLEAFLDYEKN